MKELILIVDLCGGADQLTAKRVRACNVFCEVIAPSDLAKRLDSEVKGVILSGEGTVPKEITAASIPVLTVTDCERDTERIKSFLFSDCGLKGEWTMKNFARDYVESIREKIGSKRVLCALSGGVDSSVCAALLAKAIGSQLTCLFVDHGLMRKNEPEEVEAAFKAGFSINFIRVDARERFLSKLKGVSDPEKKRKIIGEEFIRVFEEEAKKLGKIEYLMQGTIYPDVIESGIGKHKAVKSHHNVGGLPERIDFDEIIEPLYWLFKDEVRKLGSELGLSEEMTSRQPFPGPGLAVRVIGEITAEKLDILRDADLIFREEVGKAGLKKEISQYFAVMTGMKSVGIRDGARSYEYTLALRAVKTFDFMQAEFVELPYSVLRRASSRITAEVRGISRVVYDITDKPPSTIEWE